ncbi:MAG: ribonuclease Y [Candidatus Shapirobacteria bacterium]|nr:ribonuclease Y [Candidatus Shapirobacteria bacterium]
MGIFDSLLTKIIANEEEKIEGKKSTGKKVKETISSEEKLLAKELAFKIAELERKDGALEEREKLIKIKEEELTKNKVEIEEIKKKEVEKLEKISALTKQEAKDLILAATEKRIAEDLARKINEAEEEVKAHADEKAKEILIEAIQHGVTDLVAEYTVSTLHLPDDDMKGRIIGREGRNIRTFERATGVEIEIDETNDIRLSSFDPVRREIARRSIEKLIKDRRIQPSRIEEIIEKTKQEVEKIMFEEGEKLCHAVQVYRLHPELVKLLGRYKFRFSYGQNMIIHTLEETKIGIQLAYEVKANVNTVRLGCLLHDIGKIVTEEEGTHIQLGVDLARKYRIPEEVVACIAEHHEDKPFSSPESRVVWVADAASGSRPGARYEPHGEYVERMSQIEEIAREFPEVEEAFAYQAGRDVRVLVKPEKVNDNELVILASKITKSLEERASYAGQIKVTCIREIRASEVTKAK